MPIAVAFLDRAILPLDDQFNAVLPCHITSYILSFIFGRKYMAGTVRILALNSPTIGSR
jgi:hypothetical protein